MSLFGYAGNILRIDLSTGKSSLSPTADYADYLGGRGIAAKLYWDEVPPEAGAFDAENLLVFAVGPLAGLPVLGTSRWVVCGKSPLHNPEHFCYCNLGGRWGAELKFSGYDAVAVQGKSEQPVYLLVDRGIAEIRDASHLWGKGAIKTREILKSEWGDSAKVVTIGPAGENLVPTATLLADNDASGSGGLGATMGAKNLKAVVVKKTAGEKPVNIAHPDRLRQLIDYYRGLRRIPVALSPYRCTIDDDPLFNIKPIPGPKMQKDPCYGCLGRCPRRLYQPRDGRAGKFMCDSAMFYQPFSEEYYHDWNDVPFHANKLCDDYGLDTVAMNLMIDWLRRCHQTGVLNDETTGIPLSKVGSYEFIETLVSKVSLRQGFGDVLAQGVDKAAKTLPPEAEDQLRLAGYYTKSSYNVMYGPRLYITTGLFYAMEPRTPIHQLHHVSSLLHKWVGWLKKQDGVDASTDAVRAIARRFWGSELAVDFSTYEGKALAAKMVQNREYVEECLILCDWVFPIMDLQDSENHVGDPTLESKIFSAVTGNEVDEEGLDRIGERVFNLQRAILVREGHLGRDFDNAPEPCYSMPLEWNYFNHECALPGKDGEVISRKGATVERDEFERMKDEYYQIRKWDVATGLQTRAALEGLGLRHVAQDLERRGLLA